MQQAVILNIYSNPHAAKGPSQWLTLLLLSLVLHVLILLWVATYHPEFPEVTFSQFEVGLIASQGIGQTLQSSDETDTVSGVNTTDLVEAAEVSPVLLESSEESNVEEVANNENLLEAEIPIPASAEKTVSVSSTVAAETIIPEASTSDSDLLEVNEVSEFYQPTIVVADDPLARLPVEEISAVIEPSELVEASVTILEVKALDVLPRVNPPANRQSTASTEDTQTSERDESAGAQRTENRDTAQDSSSQSDTKGDTGTLTLPRSYITKLKGWLSRYKSYPPEAHRLRQEGVTIIGLKIDRAGRILSYNIKRSSGHPLLDQAVVKMIESTPQMPSLPRDFPRDNLELLVPVRFKVN